MMFDGEDIFDVFVIGGGINGVGIARDAAGRGTPAKCARAGQGAPEPRVLLRGYVMQYDVI